MLLMISDRTTINAGTRWSNVATSSYLFDWSCSLIDIDIAARRVSRRYCQGSGSAGLMREVMIYLSYSPFTLIFISSLNTDVSLPELPSSCRDTKLTDEQRDFKIIAVSRLPFCLLLIRRQAGRDLGLYR